MAASPTPVNLARSLLAILANDLPRLEKIDQYLHGAHAKPYMPSTAGAEYKMLAERAVSNWMPLVVNTPAQALYVDSFRPSRTEARDTLSPEWTHWQYSRMDARQTAVHRGALAYGHSFTVTERDARGKVVTRGLSAMRTSALYEDPANDDNPFAALSVIRWADEFGPGRARLWTATDVYVVEFLAIDDPESVQVSDEGTPHGAAECPVTRFAAAIDLEGRTMGVIEPLIVLQDRINQTVFDLLIAQTYGSFKVRYVTGMAPPVKRDPDSGEVLRDSEGDPIPAPVQHNASRMMFAEDEGVKFGSLDETPLAGFIESIDMSIRHLAAISQTPPHHLLGQIANLSAEALQAAETALSRMVDEFRALFGESWERVFRLSGQLNGDTASAEDFSGEVLWRDMESRSLAQAADALGKMVEQLGIPAEGAWERIPNVTKRELDHWRDLKSEGDPMGLLADALSRSAGPSVSDVA